MIENASHSDVIVIGAGFSGLTAAKTFADAGQRVIVLEQHDRVGGRTKTGAVAGHTIDLGGQWVAPSQNAILELASQYGVATEKQHIAGRNILNANGVLSEFDGDFPLLPDDDMTALAAAVTAIDADVAALDGHTPWGGPLAEELDAITSQEWFDENISSPAAKKLFELYWRAALCVEPNQISHLYALEYMRAAGGLMQVLGLEGAAQDATCVNGIHQIASKIAADLGNNVHLNARVRAIAQNDGQINVATDNGHYCAARLILAIPPSAIAKIQFTPCLPAEVSYAAERAPMGAVIKFFVAYETPFWRDAGYSGEVLSTDEPIKAMVDKCLPNGAGCLVGFFNAQDAVDVTSLTMDERRVIVTDHVVRHLGEMGRTPTDYIDADWLQEEGIWGGYTSIPLPGVFSQSAAALRTPFGRIHFAGTETSDRWTGYIDGAVRAGQRAAKEILQAT